MKQGEHSWWCSPKVFVQYKNIKRTIQKINVNLELEWYWNESQITAGVGKDLHQLTAQFCRFQTLGSNWYCNFSCSNSVHKKSSQCTTTAVPEQVIGAVSSFHLQTSASILSRQDTGQKCCENTITTPVLDTQGHQESRLYLSKGKL